MIGTVWQNLCKEIFTEGKELNEREVEQCVMNPTNDQYDQKMSRYLLYLKYASFFEWDSNINKDHFVIQKNRVIYTGDNVTRTAASKTVYKDKNVEFIVRYHTNKNAWFTFGIFFFIKKKLN